MAYEQQQGKTGAEGAREPAAHVAPRHACNPYTIVAKHLTILGHALMHLQVNQKLQLLSQGKYVEDSPERDRSPSPEPVYNESGARVNTREARAKEKILRKRNVRDSKGLGSQQQKMSGMRDRASSK